MSEPHGGGEPLPDQPPDGGGAPTDQRAARAGRYSEGTEQVNSAPFGNGSKGLHSQRFSDLYRRGFSAFPVAAMDKTPATKWKGYQTERATPEQMQTWDASGFNVGIAAGPVSGLLVLDLDNDDALAEARRRGWLAPTARVKTGRGWHFYYSWPQALSACNKTKLMGVTGVDIRGSGGFVVAAGSSGGPAAI